jgi:type VI secretion system protein VasD
MIKNAKLKTTAKASKLFVAMCLSATAFFSSGCTNQPTTLDLEVYSGKELNPDANGISSPLMLNFYELRDAERFLKLDFWALIDEPTKQLGADLLSQSKQVIVPQEKQLYYVLFHEEAKFLGVIASFRDIDNNATWRFVQNLDVQSSNDLELKVDNYVIEVKR